MTDMLQGDIAWAHLDPIAGSEQGGRRPVVIISGNTLNEHLPVRIVCPLTKHKKALTGRVYIERNKSNGLKQDSDVLVFQIRTLALSRFSKKIGAVTNEQVHAILESLDTIVRY